MAGTGSSDPDGDALTYLWSFGDGGTGSGLSVSHTYVQDGVYTVRLIVQDVRNLADTVFTTTTIANVAPTIAAIPGATLLPGETYSANGSFIDPGADAWSATVDYGDGSGTSALPLNAKTFSLSHVYANPGTFTVTVKVSDDDVTATRTTTVKVLTLAEGLANAVALIEGLVDEEKLNGGNANSLISKLDGAKKALDSGNETSAAGKLRALLNELEALVQSGRLTETDAQPVRALVERLLQSLAA
jgi:PKD repeat protein